MRSTASSPTFQSQEGRSVLTAHLCLFLRFRWFNLWPLGSSGSYRALRTAWCTSGTFRPKRLFRNCRATQVWLHCLNVSGTSCLHYFFCNNISNIMRRWIMMHGHDLRALRRVSRKWRSCCLCVCRRGDLNRLSPNWKHHCLSCSGKRQNHQTVEEWLLDWRRVKQHTWFRTRTVPHLHTICLDWSTLQNPFCWSLKSLDFWVRFCWSDYPIKDHLKEEFRVWDPHVINPLLFNSTRHFCHISTFFFCVRFLSEALVMMFSFRQPIITQTDPHQQTGQGWKWWTCPLIK